MTFPRMLLPGLREHVLQANLDLVRQGLVLFTFGNVSAIARENGLVLIKPSDVPYDSMTPAQLVVTDLVRNIAEGELRPSTDLPTRLPQYKAFPSSGGGTHTDSAEPHEWEPARRRIPRYRT